MDSHQPGTFIYQQVALSSHGNYPLPKLYPGRILDHQILNSQARLSVLYTQPQHSPESHLDYTLPQGQAPQTFTVS